MSTVAVGATAPPRTYGPMTRTDFVRYQGASGDFHPVHHDEVYASKAGFPSVFSVGMLQAGILATYAAEWLGPEHLRRVQVRFVEQVWPGDELTCTATVVEVEPVAATSTRVTVALACNRQTGGTAVTGTAEFVLPGTTDQGAQK